MSKNAPSTSLPQSKNSLKLYVSILLAVVWLFDGLLINLVQFLCYLTIRRFSVKLYRKINYYLTYSMWSQIVALAEWFSNSKFTVYFADEETREKFGQEHALAVMNHRYEVDWLMCWMLCDKYHILGSAKSFAKKSLQWIPVMGWCWKFCEMIFLERVWDRDSLILGKSLDKLMEYEDTVLLLLFAEGTRYTEEKYEASVQFAKEKGLQSLKYHLQPRTRGFVYTIEKIKDKLPAVYSVQLAFKANTPPPTLTSILNGIPIHGHMYVKRTAMADIPTDSTEEISQFLHRMYKEKDDLMQYFEDKQEFPGVPQTLKRRKSPLIHAVTWLVFMAYMFCYFMYKLIVTQNLIFLYTTLCLLVAAFVSVLFMIRSTKAQKGSSYGTAKATKHHEKSDDGDKVGNGTSTGVKEVGEEKVPDKKND